MSELLSYEAFKSRFRLTLNPQQEEAVQRAEGPTLLLAVPGSGKTTVLVSRLGYLIYCRGADPRSLLTVTYTRAATGDMRRRFAALFGDEFAGLLPFHTINGICHKIIYYYIRRDNRTGFQLLRGEAEASKILRRIHGELGGGYLTEQEVKELLTRIAYCKNMMLTRAEIDAIEHDGLSFGALYRAYNDHLTNNGLMDFDDQMVFALRILRQYPDILGQLQHRYRYLCVDEAQDTSKIQHAILRLLASARRNLFMVGDEDQSIYGFRAAYPQALLEFPQVYPEGAVLLMETNYRSTATIVEKADKFIRRNQSRHPKTMRTDNPSGPDIHSTLLADYRNQCNYLLKIAQDCTEQTAVLFRNNDSALPLIDRLEREGVPYTCRQRESFFFTSPVVLDLCNMLSFAFDDGNKELFLSFYYKLDFKIKKDRLAHLLRYQPEGESVFETILSADGLEPWLKGKAKALQTHFSKLPGLDSFHAITRLVRFMGYGDYLSAQGGDMTRVNILLALANQTPDVGSFLLRLQELRALVALDRPTPDCLFILSTIHSSKGLEYETVILIDVLDGLFPSIVPPPDGTDPQGPDLELLEEERRLFYVGITRAKRRVELPRYTQQFGTPTEHSSTFIDQLLDRPPVPSIEATRPTRPLPKTRDIPTDAQIDAWSKDYIPGVRVQHKQFGSGVLEEKKGYIVSVHFEDQTKRLDLNVCLKRNLLTLLGS